jgi:hypothetical protein
MLDAERTVHAYVHTGCLIHPWHTCRMCLDALRSTLDAHVLTLKHTCTPSTHTAILWMDTAPLWHMHMLDNIIVKSTQAALF